MHTFDQPTTLVPLTPGALTGFAVLSGARPGPLEQTVWWPRDALLTHGEPAPAPSDSPHLGAWHDDRTGVIQYLRPDGRYSETRNGRPDTYVGHFWIAGDDIVYHDDLDFWAYGTFAGGTLVHADFRFRRRPS
ncbi:Atu4866 domain-containing protein [Symbioplanes lichenis]|uniref:Atu4866 domain-containing protein n=1 Tax=Symbioplanes lichenis TaxID=1629072 RepID=UPI00273A0669|nr:Atu4866 domain-containing protein [Actinoplanes lichenis]